MTKGTGKSPQSFNSGRRTTVKDGILRVGESSPGKSAAIDLPGPKHQYWKCTHGNIQTKKDLGIYIEHT